MGNNEKNLEYFKNLKYDIVVRRKRDKFVLYIPELSVFEEDENLEKAYEKLESEKEKYFQNMIENDFQDQIEGPEERKIRKTFFGNLAPFFVKLILILSIIAIFLTIYNIKSNTFKYFKRASKNIAQASKDISRTLSVEQTVVKVVEALDKYEIAKEEKNLLSKYGRLTPVDVYASGSFDLHPIKFAFDSNPATFWHSSSENEAYLVVSFNIPSKLQALSITSRLDIPGTQGPEEFIIEGSDDNKSWERIDEVSQLVWGQGETKRMFIEGNSKDYIYYKFNFMKPEAGGFISIVEMQLYSN